MQASVPVSKRLNVAKEHPTNGGARTRVSLEPGWCSWRYLFDHGRVAFVVAVHDRRVVCRQGNAADCGLIGAAIVVRFFPIGLMKE